MIAYIKLKTSKENNIKLGDGKRKSEFMNSADKSQNSLRDF